MLKRVKESNVRRKLERSVNRPQRSDGFGLEYNRVTEEVATTYGCSVRRKDSGKFDPQWRERRDSVTELSGDGRLASGEGRSGRAAGGGNDANSLEAALNDVERKLGLPQTLKGEMLPMGNAAGVGAGFSEAVMMAARSARDPMSIYFGEMPSRRGRSDRYNYNVVESSLTPDWSRSKDLSYFDVPVPGFMMPWQTTVHPFALKAYKLKEAHAAVQSNAPLGSTQAIGGANESQLNVHELAKMLLTSTENLDSLLERVRMDDREEDRPEDREGEWAKHQQSLPEELLFDEELSLIESEETESTATQQAATLPTQEGAAGEKQASQSTENRDGGEQWISADDFFQSRLRAGGQGTGLKARAPQLGSVGDANPPSTVTEVSKRTGETSARSTPHVVAPLAPEQPPSNSPESSSEDASRVRTIVQLSTAGVAARSAEQGTLPAHHRGTDPRPKASGDRPSPSIPSFMPDGIEAELDDDEEEEESSEDDEDDESPDNEGEGGEEEDLSEEDDDRDELTDEDGEVDNDDEGVNYRDQDDDYSDANDDEYDDNYDETNDHDDEHDDDHDVNNQDEGDYNGVDVETMNGFDITPANVGTLPDRDRALPQEVFRNGRVTANAANGEAAVVPQVGNKQVHETKLPRQTPVAATTASALPMTASARSREDARGNATSSPDSAPQEANISNGTAREKTPSGLLRRALSSNPRQNGELITPVESPPVESPPVLKEPAKAEKGNAKKLAYLPRGKKDKARARGKRVKISRVFPDQEPDALMSWSTAPIVVASTLDMEKSSADNSRIGGGDFSRLPKSSRSRVRGSDTVVSSEESPLSSGSTPSSSSVTGGRTAPNPNSNSLLSSTNGIGDVPVSRTTDSGALTRLDSPRSARRARPVNTSSHLSSGPEAPMRKLFKRIGGSTDTPTLPGART